MHLAIVFNSTLPPNFRRDKTTIVQDINMFLIFKGILLDLKITAIKWNIQENYIVFTRTNLTAAIVLFFISELPNIIVLGYNG